MCFTDTAFIERTLLARQRDVELGVLQGHGFISCMQKRMCAPTLPELQHLGVTHPGLLNASCHHESFGDAELVDRVCNAVLT